MTLVDSHCHLDMLEDVDGALTRMRAAGVGGAVTIGVDLASSRWSVRTANARDRIWATVGLHPHDAKDFSSSLGAELEMLAADERVVGIGEAGLDYFYDHSPRDVQKAVFEWHAGLAHRSGKALVIHCRDAFPDVFEVLERPEAPLRTVFHCWSGGPAEAERALALGAVLSFSGTLTFKNAESLREAATLTPLDRMIVETDSPFLTPVPHRGKKNEPAYVRVVAEFLAAHKSVSLEDLISASTGTLRRVFGIP
ncbi:MAG: TatD family hydrolase [Actinomycetota bacterium]|nr:TatD family hydrolase [Actinomycetota bacterium]